MNVNGLHKAAAMREERQAELKRKCYGSIQDKVPVHPLLATSATSEAGVPAIAERDADLLVEVGSTASGVWTISLQARIEGGSAAALTEFFRASGGKVVIDAALDRARTAYQGSPEAYELATWQRRKADLTRQIDVEDAERQVAAANHELALRLGESTVEHRTRMNQLISSLEAARADLKEVNKRASRAEDEADKLWTRLITTARQEIVGPALNKSRCSASASLLVLLLPALREAAVAQTLAGLSEDYLAARCPRPSPVAPAPAAAPAPPHSQPDAEPETDETPE